MPIYLTQLIETLREYDIILALLFVLFYWLFKRFISATITNLAKMKSVSSTRTAFIIRCFNICCFVLLFATYIIVSGIGYGNFTISSLLFARHGIWCCVYRAVVNSK
nr:hypothetical protein [Vibrio fortis]